MKKGAGYDNYCKKREIQLELEKLAKMLRDPDLDLDWKGYYLTFVERMRDLLVSSKRKWNKDCKSRVNDWLDMMAFAEMMSSQECYENGKREHIDEDDLRQLLTLQKIIRDGMADFFEF